MLNTMTTVFLKETPIDFDVDIHERFVTLSIDGSTVTMHFPHVADLLSFVEAVREEAIAKVEARYL